MWGTIFHISYVQILHNEPFNEEQLLKTIENIVTKQINPAVHRMNSGALQQFEHETIQDFEVCLNSASIDCEFTCPKCHYDLSEIHIKDQFICGLFNDTLQTDILAKANQFKHLQDIIVHAKAFETTFSDQSKFHSSEIHAFYTKGPVSPKPNTDSSFSSTSTDSCNNSSLPRKANIQKKMFWVW